MATYVRGELIAVVNTGDEHPAVHATEVGLAPATFCGALTNRTWPGAAEVLGPDVGPAFDLIIFRPIACPECVDVIVESLHRE